MQGLWYRVTFVLHLSCQALLGWFLGWSKSCYWHDIRGSLLRCLLRLCYVLVALAVLLHPGVCLVQAVHDRLARSVAVRLVRQDDQLAGRAMTLHRKGQSESCSCFSWRPSASKLAAQPTFSAAKKRSDCMGKVPLLSSASPWIRSSGFLILCACKHSQDENACGCWNVLSLLTVQPREVQLCSLHEHSYWCCLCCSRLGNEGSRAWWKGDMASYVAGACQMVRSSAWKPKGVMVLLYAPLRAMPQANRSCAARAMRS